MSKQGVTPTNYPNTRSQASNQHPQQLQNIPETPAPSETMALTPINLPKFSDESSMPASIWWDLLENWQKCQKLDGDRLKASLPFHFSGQASIWYHNLPAETKDDLNAMKTAFMARFKDQRPNTTLFRIQQAPTETGSAYLTRIQEMALGTHDLPEIAIVGLAVNGLRPELKAYVIGRNPTSFDTLREAINLATTVAECTDKQTVQTITELCTNMMSTFSSTLKAEVMALRNEADNPPRQWNRRTTPQPRNAPGPSRHEGQTRRTCRGCGEFCLIRSSCRAFNVRCRNCNRIGHFTEVCEQPKQFSNPSNFSRNKRTGNQPHYRNF